jgi:hypothetical protein
MRRKDWQRLADLRLREAKLLLQYDFPMGAYYLGGYTIECALKAVIARQFSHETIPPKKLVLSIYDHDLAKLVVVAGLSDEFQKAQQSNPAFAKNWQALQEWGRDNRRYQYGEHAAMWLDADGTAPSDADRATLAEASEHQVLAETLVRAIEEQNGILPWLKLFW